MKETKNKFYTAVYIILFAVASLIVVASVFIAVSVLSDSNIMQELYAEILKEFGSEIDYSRFTYKFFTTAMILSVVAMLIYAGFLYVMGAYYSRYASMTNREANKYFGRCVAWTVISFIFTGLIIGSLSLSGNLTTHLKQKTDYVENGECERNFEGDSGDKYSVENLTKMKERLAKLKELDKMEALTEGEYDLMRAKILGIELPKPVEPTKKEIAKQLAKEKKKNKISAIKKPEPKEMKSVNDEKMNERLNKINTLRLAGALTEEQYNNLRDKIMQDNK